MQVLVIHKSVLSKFMYYFMQELVRPDLVIHVLITPSSILSKIIHRFPPNIHILVRQVSKLQIKYAINFIYSSNQLPNMILLMYDLIHV